MGNYWRKGSVDVTEASIIGILSYAVPIIAGACLAAIGLAKKYPTAKRYVYSSPSSWMYIVLASGGALMIRLTMRAVGTRLIQNDLLDCIFQGLLGSGLFLGIISRVSFQEINSEVGSQLKTIRDFIYEFLDDSIARRVMQRVESKIKAFGRRVDKDRLLEEASRLIGGPSKLTAEQKQELVIKFDELASRGDYVSIVRILIEYYEVDYIIDELASCILLIPDTCNQEKRLTGAPGA